MSILVFTEQEASLAALCKGARQIGERVEAVVIGAAARELKTAEKIWEIPAQDGVMLEDYTETLTALVKAERPAFLLFESTKRCKLMAGRVAAALGTSALSDVMELKADKEAARMVYGGTAVRKEKAAGTAIAVVGPGVFKEAADVDAAGTERVVFTYVAPRLKAKRIGVERKGQVIANLPGAKRVIGVGRGIAQAADLETVRSLAAKIGAEVGCTRPIAEGEGWMPKETYIGVSGLMLAPDFYLSLGISGQVQHTVGVNRAKTVVAVNKDKNAPIFKQADYGYVGDLYKVLPALLEALEK